MSRMIDHTGLQERLQQHSRRSGMMIGLSMAIAGVLIIGAFIWLFFKLDPFFSDFAGRTGIPQATIPVNRVIASPITGTPTTAVAAPALPTPTALASTPQRATPELFIATHVIIDYGQQVNLRSGPSTSAVRVALLPPGTRLRYLNEETRVGDIVWMRFQIERGDTGWMRQVDVSPLPTTNTPTPTRSR